MTDETLRDPEFIRMLAERAQFTVKDAKILWNTVKEIIDENVDKKREMYFQNFITIKFKSYQRNQWDGIHKKYVGTRPINMISIKFSFMKREYQQRKKNERLQTPQVS
jgi:nucleoid DNA-binding protein